MGDGIFWNNDDTKLKNCNTIRNLIAAPGPFDCWKRTVQIIQLQQWGESWRAQGGGSDSTKLGGCLLRGAQSATEQQQRYHWVQPQHYSILLLHPKPCFRSLLFNPSAWNRLWKHTSRAAILIGRGGSILLMKKLFHLWVSLDHLWETAEEEDSVMSAFSWLSFQLGSVKFSSKFPLKENTPQAELIFQGIHTVI